MQSIQNSLINRIQNTNKKRGDRLVAIWNWLISNGHV